LPTFGNKPNSANLTILNLLKTTLSPTHVPNLQASERRNDKGKEDTSEEYQCLVSRFPTLLLTQKWYDTATLSKPQGLMGRMENLRSSLSRAIVLKLIHHT
jgi:hypothetical protein